MNITVNSKKKTLKIIIKIEEIHNIEVIEEAEEVEEEEANNEEVASPDQISILIRTATIGNSTKGRGNFTWM